jgi:hypothetical protein
MRVLPAFTLGLSLLLPMIGGCTAAPSEESESSDGALVGDPDPEAMRRVQRASDLAELHERAEFCEEGATTQAILDLLYQAVALDESSAIENAIFRSPSLRGAIGTTLEFAVLTGRLTVHGENTAGLEGAVNALDRVDLYGPHVGGDHASKLVLRPGRRAILVMKGDGAEALTQTEARYSVRELVGGSTITLDLPDGPTTLRLRYKRGTFTLDGDEADAMLHFTSLPTECR